MKLRPMSEPIGWKASMLHEASARHHWSEPSPEPVRYEERMGEDVTAMNQGVGQR